MKIKIIERIELELRSCKDNQSKKDMNDLKRVIINSFKKFSHDTKKIKNIIKDAVYKSNIYSGLKQKIENFLKKLK